MMDDTHTKTVRFCPHCGNVAPQTLQYVHRCYEEEWSNDGEPVSMPAVYFVVSCETCNGFLVYADWGNIPNEDDFSKVDLLWPQIGLHPSIPKRVSNIYSEASRIKQNAPNAFATQIRRALEAVTDDRNAKPGSLVQRLKELAHRGEIPPILADVSDTLRILGNIGAHASETNIQPWQVHSIDEFFRAIVEYVYVAPSKLAEFRKTLRSSGDKTKKKA
jgi:hypothetical protein